jgi:hypothetical protein
MMLAVSFRLTGNSATYKARRKVKDKAKNEPFGGAVNKIGDRDSVNVLPCQNLAHMLCKFT